MAVGLRASHYPRVQFECWPEWMSSVGSGAVREALGVDSCRHAQVQDRQRLPIVQALDAKEERQEAEGRKDVACGWECEE